MTETKKPPHQPNGPVRFLKPKVMLRNWGKEIIIGVLSTEIRGATAKILDMKAGTEGNPQIHHKKFEMGYVLSGRLRVSYDPGDGTLVDREVGPGHIVYIPTGAVHQEYALEDTIVIELSSPHGNDRERVAEAYGRKIQEGALPSTKPEEVTIWTLDELEPA